MIVVSHRIQQQSGGKKAPVPQQRKSKGKKTNVKYQTLPDGKYQTPELESGQQHRRPSSDTPSAEDDEEPARYYDCFDRCGK